MSEAVHPVPPDFKAKIGPRELDGLYAVADADPYCHWMDQANRLDWYQYPE